ncbi:unnamed protein product [Adineta steineri]|uniref:Kinesin light chain n=1 Tax=Adineta steineri TaxID=433720 RepID=A0A814VMM0_9BILA|nr:unnamed protein product [Adineta steineri]CAF4045435.1 unnamed protein product [Adineta steineri]
MSGSKSNKNAVASSNICQLRRRIPQNYLLLWADTSIDETNKDYKNTLKQIRNITGDVNAFTERDACIDFLTNAEEDIQSFLVVKDTMFQQIMPLINDIPQLYCIYILNDIETPHEEWPKKWQKVKGVHTNIDNICQALQMGIKQFNQDSIAMSFITETEMASTENLNQLEPTFMYTQILKEILLDMKHDEKAIKQFTAYCRHRDCGSAKNIDYFEKKYQSQSPVWCTEQDMALGFAYSASENVDMVGILFIMSIDPCTESAPFASIKEESYFKHEEEILFPMHTVFRVCAIKQIENNKHLYQVELQLTSDDDQQLRVLTDRIREAGGGTGWQRFGNLLLKNGQFNKAKEFYNVLLEQTSNESEKAIYYSQLGCVKGDQGNYEKGIWYYEQGLKNFQKRLPSNDPYLATSDNNIGMIYSDMSEYVKALLFYGKTLEIRQKTLHSGHPKFAQLYNNIGGVYGNMGEHLKALSSHKKVLEIRGESVPSNHHLLATSYNNIGAVYDKMGEYSKALSFYNKARKIYQKTLPPNHLAVAQSYNNIGGVYYNMKDYSKSLSYCECALAIWQRALSTTHPHIKTVKQSIEFVKKKL